MTVQYPIVSDRLVDRIAIIGKAIYFAGALSSAVERSDS